MYVCMYVCIYVYVYTQEHTSMYAYRQASEDARPRLKAGSRRAADGGEQSSQEAALGKRETSLRVNLLTWFRV